MYFTLPPDRLSEFIELVTEPPVLQTFFHVTGNDTISIASKSAYRLNVLLG